MNRIPSLLALVAVLAVSSARAEELDVSKLYRLTTEGTSSALKKGEKGTYVFTIQTLGASHVSDEAPLTLKLEGKNVTPEKVSFAAADSVGKAAPGKSFRDPRFVVPITATAAGAGAVDAKVTFFICTEKLCLRQQKTVSAPITVR